MNEREMIKELTLAMEDMFTAVANGKSYQHEHDKGNKELAMHHHAAMCERVARAAKIYNEANQYLKS